MRKNLKVILNVLPLIISVIGTAIATIKNPLIAITTEESFHFSLITVNALFGGFLYTNYSLLIGLIDNATVEKVKNTNIIQKRNAHILKGIIYATISVIAGLYVVVFKPGCSFIQKLLYSFALNAELVFMAFLIVYFLLSLREMNILINAVHSPKGKKTEKEINDIREKIQSGTSK
jgi:hypothetical protein